MFPPSSISLLFKNLIECLKIASIFKTVRLFCLFVKVYFVAEVIVSNIPKSVSCVWGQVEWNQISSNNFPDFQALYLWNIGNEQPSYLEFVQPVDSLPEVDYHRSPQRAVFFFIIIFAFCHFLLCLCSLIDRHKHVKLLTVSSAFLAFSMACCVIEYPCRLYVSKQCQLIRMKESLVVPHFRPNSSLLTCSTNFILNIHR